MNLFLKGFLIGIAKIIPGVSGAMIAVSLGIYDKLINAVTSFFDNKKDNFRFLVIFGLGVLLAIVSFSNIIRYFINNYYFITMMFFVGLIVGGIIDYSKNIRFSFKNIIIISLVVLFVILISFGKSINIYKITGGMIDNIIFFIGGVIEIFSSIVPGISGTALFMLMGIYDSILVMFGNIFNISFVIDNIWIYISYGIGMGLSFIIFSILISYVLKKYRSLFDIIVFGLSMSSIILLLMMSINSIYNISSFVMGVLLFFIGICISYLFSK